MEILRSIIVWEEAAILKLGWPAWVCRSIEILVGIVSVLSVIQLAVPDSTDSTTSGLNDQNHKDHINKLTPTKMR